MFVIPDYKAKKTVVATGLQNAQVQPVITLQPRLYVVQEYPLSILSCFVYRLFDPFARITYKVTQIKNITDNVLLAKADNLASIGNNKYLVSFTDYTLITPTNKDIEFGITVFTTFNQPIVDIETYGLSLQSINIKGHIASYNYVEPTVALTESFLYPLPVALNFSLVLNTGILTQSRSVLQLTQQIGYAPDYVLYNNKYYNRSRFETPKPNEFTYTSTGVLLWT